MSRSIFKPSGYCHRTSNLTHLEFSCQSPASFIPLNYRHFCSIKLKHQVVIFDFSFSHVPHIHSPKSNKSLVKNGSFLHLSASVLSQELICSYTITVTPDLSLPFTLPSPPRPYCSYYQSIFFKSKFDHVTHPAPLTLRVLHCLG